MSEMSENSNAFNLDNVVEVRLDELPTDVHRMQQYNYKHARVIGFVLGSAYRVSKVMLRMPRNGLLNTLKMKAGDFEEPAGEPVMVTLLIELSTAISLIQCNLGGKIQADELSLSYQTLKVQTDIRGNMIHNVLVSNTRAKVTQPTSLIPKDVLKTRSKWDGPNSDYLYEQLMLALD